jgi:3-oxoacyl-[acyl-carrier protein] reductase
MSEGKDRGRWCPELAGKTAIVTGAGRYHSIGRHIALELARQGVNIVVTGTGRDPERYPEEEKAIGWRDIDSVVEEVEAIGPGGLALVSDIADPASVQAAVDAAVAKFGTVDILINNAGASLGGDRVPLVDIPFAEWRRIMAINLDGALLMAQAAGRVMIDRGKGGVIVNISSIASRQAAPTSGAYTASKAAMNAMSRVMAMELAPHRIRVNALLPGLVETTRMGKLRPIDNWDQFVKSYVPLGEAGEGPEIAWMCAFLCSDMGAWITGQDIAVDGGSSWR